MASFLRVNKVLQINLQKEQQILLELIYSIYADQSSFQTFSCFSMSKFLGDEKRKKCSGCVPLIQ